MQRFAVLAVALAAVSSAWGLTPDEVAVVYNADFAGSKALAEYYAQKRGVSAENLLALHASREEGIDRAAYLETIQKPIREWLDKGLASDASPKEVERRKQIRCILLMRGVPLLILPVEDAAKEHERNRTLGAVNQAEAEKKKLAEELKTVNAPGGAQKAEAARARIAEIDRQFPALNDAAAKAEKAWDAVTFDTSHSVESSLAVMLFTGVPVKGWVPNLLNYRTWYVERPKGLPRMFITCRLDGPNDALVRRIIDDSVEVEARGLDGIAYVDTMNRHVGGPDPRPGIIAFDDRLRVLGPILRKAGLKTVVDDAEAVFPPGSCPRAALYCGWYSLEHYIPAFTWVKGAVGFHAASWEARTLRRPDYQGWVKRMLEEGAAASLGPTWEPFITGFPDPPAFFAFLLTGRYSVAEAFWYTVPSASWTFTLVADPLYTPFKMNPKMTIAQLREVTGMPAPAPAK